MDPEAQATRKARLRTLTCTTVENSVLRRCTLSQATPMHLTGEATKWHCAEGMHRRDPPHTTK